MCEIKTVNLRLILRLLYDNDENNNEHDDEDDNDDNNDVLRRVFLFNLIHRRTHMK